MLHGTGAAHPAVGQLACAGGARTSTDPMLTNVVRSKKVPSGMVHRFMAISLPAGVASLLGNDCPVGRDVSTSDG